MTTVPTASASMNPHGFIIAGTTNIPPDGTIEPTLRIIIKAPPIAEPIEHDAITLIGSTAAIGITPSVIIHIPIGNAILMLSVSLLVYMERLISHDKATPNGGIIDAQILTASGP